jgi:hypothetical protein
MILLTVCPAPTTMDGAIATLEYAAMRDDEQTFLLESAYYALPDRCGDWMKNFSDRSAYFRARHSCSLHMRIV